MPRTTSVAVGAVLANDWDGSTNLNPYIDSANAITSRVATCASTRGLSLSSAELELVERWLAAHMYTASDPVYQSKSTEGASASFVRGKEEPEPYKARAMTLDYSGCLNAILNRKFAHASWLGKAPSEQIPYEDRD